MTFGDSEVVGCKIRSGPVREPHRRAPLIVLRDPQRVIQPGAHVVHGRADKRKRSNQDEQPTVSP